MNEISVDLWRDPDTERSVLTDLLLHDGQFPVYRDAGLGVDHFDRQAHRLIWHAVSQLGTEGVPVDAPAVRVRLGQHGTLDDVTAQYLYGLSDGEPRRTPEGAALLVNALDRYRRCRVGYRASQRFIGQLAEDPRAIDNGAVPGITETLAALQGGQSARDRFRLIDDVEMISRPAPPALVTGMIGAGTFAGIVGAPGVYKTFFAIHLGLCGTTGRALFGAPVPEPGNVIHILGEGAGSFGARLAAAKTDFGIATDTPVGYYTLPMAVDLLSPAAVGQFIAQAQPVAPRLVIVDTVNRCMLGNENATEDMTRLVAGCDRIRHELNCALLAVHHSGWDDSRERGSSVFRAAIDTLMVLRGSDVVTLHCEKQRDMDDFPDITL